MKLVPTIFYQNLNETIAIVVKPVCHIRDEDMTLKWTSKDDMESVFPQGEG